MFRRILVPLDGSALAEAALASALTVIDRAQGEIRLVSVEATGAALGGTGGSDAYLAGVKRRLGERWHGPVTTRLIEGNKVDEINREIAAWDADLLAMTTHGRGGLSRVWLGSVADRCLRSADRPVLILRPGARPVEFGRPLGIDTIVVPLDGSDVAAAALPVAIDLARELGVPLNMVRAVPSMRTATFAQVPELVAVGREIEEEAKEEASEYIRRLVLATKHEGIHPAGTIAEDVDPSAAIVSQAAGGLVVMTTHARTGLDRVVIGSVADKVIRASTGPILVMPPRSHR